jgi:hypothetical protein
VELQKKPSEFHKKRRGQQKKMERRAEVAGPVRHRLAIIAIAAAAFER